MKTIRTKVYTFNELSKAAQKTAIRENLDININPDFIKEDAYQIGLDLTDIDYNRSLKGEFITSAGEVVENILREHGSECQTYKIATRYKNAFQLNSSEAGDEYLSEREDLFLRELLKEYEYILQRDYDYQTSDDGIAQTLIANDYYFTNDGKQFNQ